MLTADVQHAIFPGEDVVRIFIAAEVAQERIKILRLKQMDCVVGLLCGAADKRDQKKNQESWHDGSRIPALNSGK
jgi:hypothetical protein